MGCVIIIAMACDIGVFGNGGGGGGGPWGGFGGGGGGGGGRWGGFGGGGGGRGDIAQGAMGIIYFGSLFSVGWIVVNHI